MRTDVDVSLARIDGNLAKMHKGMTRRDTEAAKHETPLLLAIARMIVSPVPSSPPGTSSWSTMARGVVHSESGPGRRPERREGHPGQHDKIASWKPRFVWPRHIRPAA